VKKESLFTLFYNYRCIAVEGTPVKISSKADAVALEKAVLEKFRATFQSDAELGEYVAQVQTCKLSQLEIVETQIKTVESQLRDTKKDEEKLFGVLTSQNANLGTLDWLNEKVATLRRQKEDQEAKIRELQRERDYLTSTRVEAKKLRTTLGRIFSTLEQAWPAKKRGLLRQVFREIRVYGSNRVEIRWSIPGSISPAVTVPGGGLPGLSLLLNGGSDGTRTHDLRRDRATL
jgi:chaperonin cofactor prefoldin